MSLADLGFLRTPGALERREEPGEFVLRDSQGLPDGFEALWVWMRDLSRPVVDGSGSYGQPIGELTDRQAARVDGFKQILRS